MKSPKTLGLAVAEMSGAAPAGASANVVGANELLVKALPGAEQRRKRGRAVVHSLSETSHYHSIPSLRLFRQRDI
jgi:hypothetical protein